MKLPISVIILTYNEEQNIRACLESVKDMADAIFVVDSYSTDKTLEIAREYTDNIFQHPFDNYAVQRNWAQDNLQIKNEWLFHLDADERVTSELSRELKIIFSGTVDDVNGYLISRRTIFMSRWIKHGGHYPAYHLRLFRKSLGRCEDRLYDQHFYVGGKIEILKSDIIDTVTSDFDNWKSRHNKWAKLEALEVIGNQKENVIKGNPRGTPIEQRRWFREIYYKLPMFIRASLYFIYRYFFKLGILDGKEGMIFHFYQGFWYRFLVDVEINELKKRALNKESLLMPFKSRLSQIRKPVVVLETLEANSDLTALKKQFSNAFTRLSIADDFNKASSVFIKPNLGYPVYKKGVTTRKEFIEGLVSALRELNSKTIIYIGDGEGGYNSFSINEAFKTTGLLELGDKYPNVRIVNLSTLPSRDVEIQTPKGPYTISLPKLFFDEIDFSISCPVPKVHCMTGVSLSYKNQWGCLPDAMRLKDHHILDHIVSKISDVLKFKYTFLDGKYGLNNNGPLVGDAVETNWFAASNSLGAFDMVVSEMMGIDWKDISHLKMAGKYGFIPERESVDIIGDIGLLKRRFVLKRDFWNYPALAAFHSRRLTHLVYFSKCAKLLHDIMYAFRKRPIQS